MGTYFLYIVLVIIIGALAYGFISADKRDYEKEIKK